MSAKDRVFEAVKRVVFEADSEEGFRSWYNRRFFLKLSQEKFLQNGQEMIQKRIFRRCDKRRFFKDDAIEAILKSAKERVFEAAPIEDFTELLERMVFEAAQKKFFLSMLQGNIFPS